MPPLPPASDRPPPPAFALDRSLSMASLRLAAGRAEWRGRVLVLANLLLAFTSAVLLASQVGGWTSVTTYTVSVRRRASWSRPGSRVWRAWRSAKHALASSCPAQRPSGQLQLLMTA